VEVKPYPAPPDVEYSLDCLCDMNEVDPTTVATLKLYGDRKELMRWVDLNTDEFPQSVIDAVIARGFTRRWRQLVKPLAFAGMADEILRQLPPDRAGALIYLGWESLRPRIVQYADFLATWAITDACEGGCEIAYRRRPIPEPGPRLARRLHSPKFIKRYVRSNSDMENERLGIEHTVGRSVLVPHECIQLEGHEGEGSVIYDLRQQHVRQGHAFDRTTYEQTQRRRFMPICGRSEAPRKRKAARKAAVRSLHAAAAIIGQEDAARLARGEAIVVAGAETSLRLQKNDSIMSKGHGCLDVDLLTQDGAKLADLCVYVKDTPTLDQAAGMALFFQSGEDRALIESANIMRLTPLGESHPALEPIRQRQIAQRVNRQRIPSDVSTARNRAYWQETRPMWIMAVGTYVLGSRAAQQRFIRGLI
jgi:hypothetical protein